MFWKRRGRWAVPVPVPSLMLHLDGADWESLALHLDGAGWESLTLHLDAAGWEFEDHGMRVICLVLDVMVGNQTVTGNYQQNTQVVDDLDKDVLPFAPAQCDKLVASL